MANSLTTIPGWPALCEWSGGVPTFADGPILSLDIALDGTACIVLKAWPLDAQGRYRHDEPARVTFQLDRVTHISLRDPLPNSIVDHLMVEETEQGFVLRIEAAFGLEGCLQSQKLWVRFEPFAAPASPI